MFTSIPTWSTARQMQPWQESKLWIDSNIYVPNVSIICTGTPIGTYISCTWIKLYLLLRQSIVFNFRNYHLPRDTEEKPGTKFKNVHVLIIKARVFYLCLVQNQQPKNYLDNDKTWRKTMKVPISPPKNVTNFFSRVFHFLSNVPIGRILVYKYVLITKKIVNL